MKRSILFLLTVAFIISGLSSVYAANIKKLKVGTTYKLDLNGGNRESVKIELFKGNYEGATWYLYVDGMKAARFKCNEICWGIQPYYVDVNKKDKYKEIIVMTEGNNYGFIDARIVRYCSNKIVKVIPLKDYVRNMRLASCDGNNNLYFWMDTPFINYKFGSYYCKVRGYVSSKKIVLKKQKKYTLEVPNMGLSYNRKSYELKRSMKLYKTASRKSVKQTLKPGTKFSALEIKPSKSKFWDYNSIGDVYVKVKTTSGKKGWLLFPGSSSGKSYLVLTPGWG